MRRLNGLRQTRTTVTFQITFHCAAPSSFFFKSFSKYLTLVLRGCNFRQCFYRSQAAEMSASGRVRGGRDCGGRRLGGALTDGLRAARLSRETATERRGFAFASGQRVERPLVGSYEEIMMSSRCVGSRSHQGLWGPRRTRQIGVQPAFSCMRFFVSCKNARQLHVLGEKLPLCTFDLKRKERPDSKASACSENPQDKRFLRQIAAFFFYTMMESTSVCGALTTKGDRLPGTS